jgi:hypothetical protein
LYGWLWFLFLKREQIKNFCLFVCLFEGEAPSRCLRHTERKKKEKRCATEKKIEDGGPLAVKWPVKENEIKSKKKKKKEKENDHFPPQNLVITSPRLAALFLGLLTLLCFVCLFVLFVCFFFR